MTPTTRYTNRFTCLLVSVSIPVALSFGTTVIASELPKQIEGKVVYVDDGDTLVLLDKGHNQVKIRLTDADAPETPKENQGRAGQPFSKASSAHLASLVKGRSAVALCYERDRFKREVCRVTVDGRDVSLEQIRAGMAWANAANPSYVRDPRAYEYERAAREKRIGLWSSSQPVPPWKWRRDCWQDRQCNGAGS